MSIDFVSKANEDVPRSFITLFGSLFCGQFCGTSFNEI